MTIKSSYLDFIIKCNDGLAQEMYENDKILYVIGFIDLPIKEYAVNL